MGPTPDPPAPMSDEDWIRLDARVRTLGSRAVRDALERYSKASHSELEDLIEEELAGL